MRRHSKLENWSVCRCNVTAHMRQFLCVAIEHSKIGSLWNMRTRDPLAIIKRYLVVFLTCIWFFRLQQLLSVTWQANLSAMPFLSEVGIQTDRCSDRPCTEAYKSFASDS